MATINCPKCGTTISGEGSFCPHCGASIYSQPEQDNAPASPYAPGNHTSVASYDSAPPHVNTGHVPPHNNAPRAPQPGELPPKTWLLESILATIFCCLPAGLVGIIYASKVESSWYAGQRELAQSSANTAKTWTIVSFVVGFAGILIYVLMVAFGVMAGFWSGMNGY